MKISRLLIPLGMVAVVFYFAHVITGQLLWSEYDPLTMDISSLTADGAPNAAIIRAISIPYGICSVLFALGMVIRAFCKHGVLLRAGYCTLLLMELISVIGYNLFPLTGDKTEMTFQNMMHIVVTIGVVFTTIGSGFLIALGYLKQEKMKRLGAFTLFMAILITLFGSLNPINMANGWNLLGLTERLCIYSVQTLIFVLSLAHTRINAKEAKRIGS